MHMDTGSFHVNHDDILFYFTEYTSQRKEYADNLKKAFNDLIDITIKEIEEER